MVIIPGYHRPILAVVGPTDSYLISTERYMAVCAPLTAYRIGRRRLRSATVVIVAASVAFNAPRFFEFRPTAVPLKPPPPPPPPPVMPLPPPPPSYVSAGGNQSATVSTPSGVTMIILNDTWLRYDEVYH